MERTRISQVDNWELENPEQDIRGWSAVDASGQTLGQVSDLIVNEQAELIDGIVLDNGREYTDDDWMLSDGHVVIGGDADGGDSGLATAGAAGTGNGSSTHRAGETASTERTAGRDSFRVRRYAEDLQAQKQQVQAGEVGIRKDVVEREQTLDVPVTHEEVEIRRVATDRPATGDEHAFADGDTIRVPVVAERVQVSKDARVVEELEISKRAVTENQRVSETVREEQIEIDRQGDVDVADGASRERTAR